MRPFCAYRPPLYQVILLFFVRKLEGRYAFPLTKMQFWTVKRKEKACRFLNMICFQQDESPGIR